MMSFSPNFEDVLLERCFRHVPAGFYVDIGAHHPTNASITRWFYDRGWSGINIEPGEGIEALRAGRPRDINLEMAVADFEGYTTFYVHSANTGTSTLSRSVAEIVAEKAGEIQPRTVQVTMLSTILDRYAKERHIHFLKVDAEGSEDAIVRNADWSRHRPEVVVIESTEPYTNVRRKESWQDVLKKNRYNFVYFDGVNDFWVRAESGYLAEKFSVPVNVLDYFQSYNPEVDILRTMIARRDVELVAAHAAKDAVLNAAAPASGLIEANVTARAMGDCRSSFARSSVKPFLFGAGSTQRTALRPVTSRGNGCADHRERGSGACKRRVAMDSTAQHKRIVCWELDVSYSLLQLIEHHEPTFRQRVCVDRGLNTLRAAVDALGITNFVALHEDDIQCENRDRAPCSTEQ